MHKYLLYCSIFLFSFATQAQERFVNNLFKVGPATTETYATKDGEALQLDVYQPLKDEAASRPLIIFMHGGGFAGGTRTNEGEVNFAKAAAQKGYVAVSISYRLTRKGESFSCDYEAEGKIKTFRLAAEDFMDAVHFMLKNKEKYKIDTSNVIVGGSSAGAEAVLIAVYNERLMFPDLKKYDNVHFAGVFSLAGAIVDARYITEENAVPGVFFHGTEDNLVPYATGPHHWCDRDQPGYLFLDGSRTITQRLKELDTSYLLFSFEGGKHEHSGMLSKIFY
ncbi:alpha/beta hydrolase fold domain-containing protein [Antarcticibacterium sp. 1MA-6-2]|uniref:alpha/beta hydrolase n=1 Tax=Antarcticibacterium sp. 1MA-6-2 TaxID=2908210 RepID=UPI001F462E19|nr:alpha/beta hydrolase [Antarcticibacterium sp. 1MA-6-2]UJH92745.1 alpha/beta hydrolase fold domain-containing protein [Antarcticibacterium sp. 1MA-6-2]